MPGTGPSEEHQTRVSVVIPAINEVGSLPRLVEQLRAQQGVFLDIVVADGGSGDGSLEWLQKQKDIRLVRTPRGRASQLNAGAAAARFPLCLFLHADSGLPDPQTLERAVHDWERQQAKTRTRCAGHFSLQFERNCNHYALAFAYLQAKSASNRRHTINGDQGLLIEKDFLGELGGFDESLPFMEDQAIAEEIFQRGEWLLLPGTLTTSARRFETEGFHRRYWLMGLMMACYWSGGRDFFARARQVYPTQSEARKLRLWPYLRAFWIYLFRDAGLGQAPVLIYRFGRYAGENSWQFFFFLDICLKRIRGNTARRLTRFHDRFLRLLFNNPLSHLLLAAAVLSCLVLLSISSFIRAPDAQMCKPNPT